MIALYFASSTLVVYHPKELRDKINSMTGEIQSSLANFGNIPYGHSIIGRLWHDVQNQNGCNEFVIDINGFGDPDIEPSPIVIVNRGNCSFVKKVRNIEREGVKTS